MNNNEQNPGLSNWEIHGIQDQSCYRKVYLWINLFNSIIKIEWNLSSFGNTASFRKIGSLNIFKYVLNRFMEK